MSNFPGYGKKGMRIRPNFEEQIPDVYKGIGLKKNCLTVMLYFLGIVHRCNNL